MSPRTCSLGARPTAGLLRVRCTAVALTLTLVGGGCAIGGGDPPSASRTPRRELGKEATQVPASVAAPAETTATTVASQPAGGNVTHTTAKTTATSATPTGPDSTAAPAPTRSTATTAPARQIASVSDRTGDVAGAPPYGDLTELTIGDTGTGARFTVRLAGSVPIRLADGEVAGIGIDIYKGATVESDYQVYADGGSGGWVAYLHTPGGFVEYPGTFSIGGDLLTFEVPWSAIGGVRSGNITAFADWSRKAVPQNIGTTDALPDLGMARFSR